jgi:hypothetical protein
MEIYGTSAILQIKHLQRTCFAFVLFDLNLKLLAKLVLVELLIVRRARVELVLDKVLFGNVVEVDVTLKKLAL